MVTTFCFSPTILGRDNELPVETISIVSGLLCRVNVTEVCCLSAIVQWTTVTTVGEFFVGVSGRCGRNFFVTRFLGLAHNPKELAVRVSGFVVQL